MRKRIIAAALVSALAFGLLGAQERAGAQESWPSRPLTMVVPYAPGGSTDLVARLLAPGLGAALGQPVLLENMAGVGGIAGVSRVASSAAFTRRTSRRRYCSFAMPDEP